MAFSGVLQIGFGQSSLESVHVGSAVHLQVLALPEVERGRSLGVLGGRVAHLHPPPAHHDQSLSAALKGE